MDVQLINAADMAQISYTVTFPEAQAHYADIEMDISNITKNIIELKMPVWTPGSYLVREFSKNVESFSATAGGRPLAFEKTRKNWWRITTGGARAIVINYRVYCNEISVRTSTVNTLHGFISPAGIFMYPDGMLRQHSTIHIVPYTGWTKVSTSLESVNGDPFTLHAPNYDILFDSPIEVGNQEVFGFDAAGVKYEVAMYGGGSYDKERLKRDMPKIVAQETAVYGENPNKRYVFIVHNYQRGGGGLEHLSSAVLGASRDAYASESGYQNFLTLVAHEHFHLWNVKRLRPIALGPFDYDNENYTTDLWIAEGFTAYYEDIILRHANMYPPANYLNVVANNINQVENTPGRKIQTVAAASFDAWIKAYRPNENSLNSTISYYSKGSVLALLLNLEIINNSRAKYSLDDVMKYMYNEYYKTKKRGYTDKEFKQGLEKFAGKTLDDFYKKYVYGLDCIDYDKYLAYAGYKITDDLAASNNPSLGIATLYSGGRNLVTAVTRDGAGWVGGINTDDEITAIDSNAVTDMTGILAGKKPGDKITVTVNRDGRPLTLPITLLRNPQVKYRIDTLANLTPQQLTVRNKWLKL